MTAIDFEHPLLIAGLKIFFVKDLFADVKVRFRFENCSFYHQRHRFIASNKKEKIKTTKEIFLSDSLIDNIVKLLISIGTRVSLT